MGREIKFRTWDKRFKRMNYGSPMAMLFQNDGDHELMQYTGLRDKNGTEIYEGDIVHEHDEWGEDGRFEVEFSYNGFWLKYREANEFGFGDPDEMEVIGNIFENPELLK